MISEDKFDVLRDAIVQELQKSLMPLLEELEAYRSAAQYDAKMEGPMFKGWNRSALERARLKTVTATRIGFERSI